MSELLTTAEFAAEIRLSGDKVRQRIRRGEIRAINVGTDKRRIYRITRAEVHRYLEARATDAA